MGSKMLNALLLIVTMEFAMLLFPKDTMAQTSLSNFLLDPTAWLNAPWWAYLIGVVAVVGTLGAIVIGSFIIKQDWVWRAGIASGSFISFMAVIVQFWTYVYSFEFLGAGRGLLTSLFTVGFLLYYTMAVIDFVGGSG